MNMIVLNIGDILKINIYQKKSKLIICGLIIVEIYSIMKNNWF